MKYSSPHAPREVYLRETRPRDLPVTRNVRPTFRRGFTLIEILVVITFLVMIMGLISALLVAALLLEHSETAAFNRMMVRAAVADQFRNDVAEASAAPAQWKNW